MGETLTREPVEEVVLEAERIVQEAADTLVLPEDERVLTEIDNLAMGRNKDGTYPSHILDSTRQNIFTMVQEGAMRYAITKTEHVAAEIEEAGRRKRTFMWLGKTALQVAESGYQFHHHEAARARVGVEVEEALHNDEAMREGHARLLISPRMSAKDAPAKIAKREHLHDDDAIRMSIPEIGPDGQVIGRTLQSLLIRDIPLPAWNSYLQDPSNVFGRAFYSDDPESALPIMKLHTEMEVPIERLPEGLLTIVAEVIPHIEESRMRAKVQDHLDNFRGYDQQKARQQSMNIAERWVEFKKSMVDSRFEGQATPPVREFIASLAGKWDDEAQRLIAEHTAANGTIVMSRKLEVLIAEAYANLAFKRAKVISGDTSVLEKADAAEVAQIRKQEQQIQTWQEQGYDLHAISQQELTFNELIASQDIAVGGGCAGESNGRFGSSTPRSKMSAAEAEASAGDQQDAAETAQEIMEEAKAEGDGIPPKVRCVNCNKESKKELVIKPDKWQCPCCKYAVDICTGDPLNPGLENFGQRLTLIASLVELTAPVEAAVAAEPSPVEETEELVTA